jgi:hypothetical protein
MGFDNRCMRCNGAFGHTSSSCKKPYFKTDKEVSDFFLVAYNEELISGKRCKIRVERYDKSKTFIDSWIEEEDFEFRINASDGNGYWVNSSLSKIFLSKEDFLLNIMWISWS